MINKRKIIKVITTFVTILICTTSIANASVASIVNPNTTATGSFEKPISMIIGIFQVVAVGLGVIMMIALAVKYMTAAPSDRAEIKKHAVVYVVGAFIAFASTGLMQILKTFVEEAI